MDDDDGKGKVETHGEDVEGEEGEARGRGGRADKGEEEARGRVARGEEEVEEEGRKVGEDGALGQRLVGSKAERVQHDCDPHAVHKHPEGELQQVPIQSLYSQQDCQRDPQLVSRRRSLRQHRMHPHCTTSVPLL